MTNLLLGIVITVLAFAIWYGYTQLKSIKESALAQLEREGVLAGRIEALEKKRVPISTLPAAEAGKNPALRAGALRTWSEDVEAVTK